MKHTMRKALAAAVALCLGFVLGGPALRAGASVDTTQKCAVAVGLDAGYLPTVAGVENYGSNVELTTSLYRVASVDTYYAYTALGTFASNAAFTEGLENYASKNAEAQMALAATVAGLIDPDAAQPAASAQYTADQPGTLGYDASGAPALDTGLYLMLTTAEDTAGYYDYSFSPVLLSLPSMAKDGNDVYELTGDMAVQLKGEATPKTASIQIEKRLPVYSTMQGQGVFVFRVDATMPVTENGQTTDKLVYSEVFPLMFTAAGTQTKLVEGLPLGATVTVTEVYCGSSYALDKITAGDIVSTGMVVTSDATARTAVTTLKPAFAADGTPETRPLIAFTFTNRYSGEERRGTAVNNILTYNGAGNASGWTPEYAAPQA